MTDGCLSIIPLWMRRASSYRASPGFSKVVMAGSCDSGVSVACHLANPSTATLTISASSRSAPAAATRSALRRPAPIAAWTQPRAARLRHREAARTAAGGGRGTAQQRGVAVGADMRQHLNDAHEVAGQDARARRVALSEQREAVRESAVDVSLLCFDDREAELRLDGDLTTAHR